VLRYPAEADFLQRAVLLRNVERSGRRFFEEVRPVGGDYFQRELLGRGLAVGDLNHDGWPDLVISHSNSPAVVLLNAQPRWADHHWLGVELAGKDGRDVAGATVTLELDQRKLTRLLKAGGSYLSSGDRRLLFGLGETDKPVSLTVRWPWGEDQQWQGLEPDAYYRLREAEPHAQRVPVDEKVSADAPRD
jgi:hypothetical protein